MAHDVGARQVNRLHEAVDIMRQTVRAIAAGRSGGAAMAAQVQHDQAAVGQKRGQERPAAGIVGIAMQQQERRAIGIAGFDIGHGQAIGGGQGLAGGDPVGLRGNGRLRQCGQRDQGEDETKRKLAGRHGILLGLRVRCI